MGNSPSNLTDKIQPSPKLKDFLNHTLSLHKVNKNESDKLSFYWIVDPQKQTEHIKQRILLLGYLLEQSKIQDQIEDITFIRTTLQNAFATDFPTISQKEQKLFITHTPQSQLLELIIRQIYSQEFFDLDVAWDLRILSRRLIKMIRDKGKPNAATDTLFFEKVVSIQNEKVLQFDANSGKLIQFLSFFTVYEKKYQKHSLKENQILVKIEVPTKNDFMLFEHQNKFIFSCFTKFQIANWNKQQKILNLKHSQMKDEEKDSLHDSFVSSIFKSFSESNLSNISNFNQNFQSQLKLGIQKALRRKKSDVQYSPISSVSSNPSSQMSKQEKLNILEKKTIWGNSLFMYFNIRQRSFQDLITPNDFWSKVGNVQKIMSEAEKLKFKGLEKFYSYDYRGAIQMFNEALKGLLQTNNNEERIRILYLKGKILEKFQKFKEAFEIYQLNSKQYEQMTGVLPFEKVIKQCAKVRCLCEIDEIGNITNARKMMEKITLEIIKLDEYEAYAESLLTLGICYLKIDKSTRMLQIKQNPEIQIKIESDWQMAITFLEKAENLFQQIFKPMERAYTLVYISDALRFLRRYQQSEIELYKALNVVKKHFPKENQGISEILSQISLRFGHIFMQNGDPEKALKKYAEAIEKLPHKQFRASLLHKLRSICFGQLDNLISKTDEIINNERVLVARRQLKF